MSIKITVLGTGTFFIDQNITASAFIVDTGNSKILVDCGPGTLVKLSQAGIKPQDIDYVFITHFHPDHTSDLFPLFMNFRLSDIFEPGKITKFPTFFGPPGIGKFMSDYAKLTELLAVEGWDKIKFIDYSPTINLQKITVKTYKVLHDPFNLKAKAYALRFEIDKKIISFSGDAGLCDGIRNVCKNADVFICDTSFPKTQQSSTHMNTHEIGEVAQNGNVKRLLLDHFYPQFAKSDLVEEIKENYEGDVRKLKDLEVIEV